MKRREFLIAGFGITPLFLPFLGGRGTAAMAQSGRVIRHAQSVSINASTRATLEVALTATRNAVASVGAESNA